MRLAIPKETADGERRVAFVPETVKRMIAKKLEVHIESGAGAGAYISDDEYRTAGATIEPSLDALLAGADAVVKISVPTGELIGRLREGSALISLLYPLVNRALVKSLSDRRITAISADSIPRTTL